VKKRARPPKTEPSDPAKTTPPVEIDLGVVRQIRRHARASPQTEVCGVLIGHDSSDLVRIVACIEGQNTAQGDAHVTFTQETWAQIFTVKDKQYPGHRIVGWYHSHPGFGIFLSGPDTFLHTSYFSAAGQVAWVYDPRSDEEGCFGWRNGAVTRLTEIRLRDSETGPVARKRSKAEQEIKESARGSEPGGLGKWRRVVILVVSHGFAVLIGVILGILFARPTTVIVERQPPLQQQARPVR
jgi:proteasome lid subunit RPN8/RPN11